MIQLLAYDPINYWLILKEKDSIYLLKYPYASVSDKSFLSQDQYEEALNKRGFLLKNEKFLNLEEVISFIEKERVLRKESIVDTSNKEELEEVYSYIPDVSLNRFITKYEVKIPTLSIEELDRMKYIINLILTKNKNILKNETLQKKYLTLNDACESRLNQLGESSANKFKDLSKAYNAKEIMLSAKKFFSPDKRLLNPAYNI